MTICAVLNNNKEKLYGLIDSYKIEEARLYVLELLDLDDLKANKDVPKAKIIFNNCKGKTNLFISTLVTYMTCLKA